MIRFALATVLLASLSACSSRSVLPDAKEVTVSREAPNSRKCVEVGKLTGTSSSIKGTREQALEDLKVEAANKGANYVMVKQYSDMGTAVTGIGYECH